MSDPVLDLFTEAIDLAPDERTAYLDRFCGGNAELRRKVEALLAQDAAASKTFLPLPPPNPRLDALFERPDAPDMLIGRTVGPYTIKSRIASGGMGTVYLAQQANPRREVALKILHGGLAGSGVRRRFEHEAQILALLRHPNIAQVYEAGTAIVDVPDGPPRRLSYFAMEYVPGAAGLIAYAEALHLSLRRRLELFADICDAVHHGHQRGIVHRDLKPANILVDDAGRPKIVDFGIARVTDADVAVTSMRTDAGQLIGTLAYMSPEQCAADPREIHTPSDVYSLGVVLFELLTGRLPYDVSHLTIHAAARMICEQTPAPPSQFDRSLKGDVETIVLKAMEKDRSKRYASAAALAEDIRRHLRGEPITARPPTRLTRLLGWVARRPKMAAFVGGASIAASMFFGAETGIRMSGMRRPDRVQATDDNKEVRLLSLNKDLLKVWKAGPNGAVYTVPLFKQDPAFGGKTIALLGNSVDSQTWPGRLCAIDVNGNWDKPIWSVGIEADDLPSRLKGRPGIVTAFGADNLMLADVFPQSPGEEILCIYSHSLSNRTLCIYDAGGTLLYRVWQDGVIRFMNWLEGPKILVLCGGNEWLKDGGVDGSAIAVPGATFANVIFAIRPQFGFKSLDYLRTQPGKDALDPVWYKYLVPLATPYLPLYSNVSRPTAAYNSKTDTDVQIILLSPDFKEQLGVINLTIDERGDEIEHSRILGDAYRRNASRLPKQETVRLQTTMPTSITE